MEIPSPTSGNSAERITKQLNADGVPSPKGGVWIRDTVIDILKRPAYCGDHRFNYWAAGKYYHIQDGKPVERESHWIDDDHERPRKTKNDPAHWICLKDHWPVIVGRDLWERTQQRVAHNHAYRPKTFCHDYRFSSLVHCQCDVKLPMHGVTVNGQRKYRCKSCKMWVRESELIEQISQAVLSQLTPQNMKRSRDALVRKAGKLPKQNGSRVKSLEKQLAKQNKKLVVLDADTVGPVQDEIRRLRREIEVGKHESRQGAAASPLVLVQRAMESVPATTFRESTGFSPPSLTMVVQWGVAHCLHSCPPTPHPSSHFFLPRRALHVLSLFRIACPLTSNSDHPSRLRTPVRAASHFFLYEVITPY